MFWRKNKKNVQANNNEVLNESAKRIVAQVANSALLNSDINDSLNFKYATRNILNTKMQRANGDESMYIESLKTNVLYLVNICDDIENLIESWFRNKAIPASSVYLNNFNAIQQNNRISNLHEAKNSNILKTYDEKFPVSKRIENLEWDYIYYSAYSNILIQCMGVIGENENLVNSLFEYAPSKVIDEIKGYCNMYTNHCIGNSSFKPVKVK